MEKTSMELMLESLIPISVLNKGKAAQIISDLGPQDVKVIVKNNEPMAAIVPISRLTELLALEAQLKGGSHE
ncbi:MAG: hypothetical protein Q4F12_01170 [Erysipelotrichaceae bacterium]|nr:hypothetical protein [Erysipelotrichaceae bacterium]